MKKVGFVIADDGEFAPVKKYALENGGREYQKRGDSYVKFTYADCEITAVWCGVGKVNAASGAAWLIADESPEMVFNFGLSGAIHNVRKNEIVIGTKFIEHDFDLTPLGYEMSIKPQAVSHFAADERLNKLITSADSSVTPCVFVTGDMFVGDADRKNFIIEKFGGNCCDMESAAIASVCYKAGVPFASLRVMSDDADEAAADKYRETNALEDDALLKIVLKALEQA